jgi:hypothetical protein
MSETHSDHKDEHGHDDHHEGDTKHGEHGAGHGDAHGGGHGAEHGHGDAHGGHGAEHGHGHGHGHDEFAQYLHDPKKKPTPEQRKALRKIAEENAKKLRGKPRAEAIKAIEALQKDHHVQEELGTLIYQLWTEIIKILEK